MNRLELGNLIIGLSNVRDRAYPRPMCGKAQGIRFVHPNLVSPRFQGIDKRVGKNCLPFGNSYREVSSTPPSRSFRLIARGAPGGLV